MGCSSCATSGSAGCQNKGHCNSGGCNKLNVFDWLSDMDVPATHRFSVVEVRFKNGRKDFFRNTHPHDIVTGDAVVVDVPSGHDIGYVSLQGELVRLQMSKKSVPDDEKIRNIYRKASLRDLQKWEEVRNKESGMLYRTKQIITDMQLEMKLTDVAAQADGTKAVFYYSAEGRVDFRELVKKLAGEFKIRIEMRQINVRQEAGRIGGIGVCGRELCCSTWLTYFKNVTTSAARYQNLSLNPAKLSGQCGRLKCCLNYELDTYTEVLKDIPQLKESLLTQKGAARLEKTDIFRKIMWFSYESDPNWVAVTTPRVREIQKLNDQGIKPHSLVENDAIENLQATPHINSDLAALDKKFMKKKKFKKKQKHKEKR